MQSLTEQKAERRDLDRAFAFRRSALSINHHGVESHSASTAAVESRVSIAPNLDFNSPRAPQILSRLSELPRKVKDDIWGIAAMAELHAIPKKGNMTFVNFEVGTFLHEQIRGIKAVRSLERYNFDGFVLQRVTRFEVVSRPLTTYGRKIVRILRKRSLKNTRLSFDDRQWGKRIIRRISISKKKSFGHVPETFL